MQQVPANPLFNTGGRAISSLDHTKIRRDPIEWPNGARVAVTWSVIFELLPGASEGRTAAYNNEDAKKSLYSARRGVWRVLDLLDLHQTKASFLINGYAAERFPAIVMEIKKNGHEIVPYGYTSSRYLDELTPEEEKRDILRTLDIFEKVTGARPTGWISPDLRPGDRTLAVLAEAGIMWNGDFPNDDLPYVVKVGGKPMVIIPYTKESDDREIYQKNLQLPTVWTDCFIDSLDVLHEEGLTHPKMLNASLRLHLLGRAVGTKAVEQAIRYAKSLPQVWLTNRTEIAQWWLQRKYS
jgi:allantoinase